ncbi:hypothetical protein U9M48_042852 [Paspalum notatum var. saurae]|uniref:Retrotransposon gag domain-containing protein n=1 Tax=Paspalum notatum var. saurae TaxID=547442 RepID=A0AAQ3URM6_PASNO
MDQAPHPFEGNGLLPADTDPEEEEEEDPVEVVYYLDSDDDGDAREEAPPPRLPTPTPPSPRAPTPPPSPAAPAASPAPPPPPPAAPEWPFRVAVPSDEGGQREVDAWVDLTHPHHGADLEFPGLLRDYLYDLGYTTHEVVYQVRQRTRSDHTTLWSAGAQILEPNPNHGGHTVLRRHYSIAEHETMEMAMEDAALSRLLGCGDLSQHEQVNGNQGGGNPLPNPPPLTPEQFYNLQMQMMATMTNAVHVLQQAQTQPPPPPPRDRRGDFLKGHPPTFSHATEPLQADDWLRAVECQLDIAQCNGRERVLYGSGQLRGAALDWWESYRPQDRDAFTWAQFKENFRNHHVPVGLMKMKKKEFLSTKQGSMSVTEYRDKFLRLAGYACAEVARGRGEIGILLEGSK